MNKPAPKEPSMDEILSSIRQIIADDDAAIAPSKPLTSTPSALRPLPDVPARPASAPASRPTAGPTPEPLALSPEQIVANEGEDEVSQAASGLSFDDILGDEDEDPQATDSSGGPELVDPEDVAFDPEPEPEPEAQPAPPPRVAPPPHVAAAPPPSTPQRVQVAPRSFAPEPPRTTPRPAASVAQTAPMPDPKLSNDMAEQLLQPTTEAAVKHTLSRLNGLSMVGSGVTIEDMMRDLLRPMLKEWLDENLPATVERMVEKEIARLARGE